MNRNIHVAIATVAGAAVAGFIVTAEVSAQVAGSTLLGVAYADMRSVTDGWSAKRQLLGDVIYNEKAKRSARWMISSYPRKSRFLRDYRGRRLSRRRQA